MDITELKCIIDMEKENGKIVVLGCGCFEIFHIGHLEYLYEAKRYGDILVIGVNTDDYIMRNKNRKPIFSLSQRMQIINSIKPVDYVFFFNDETFDRSISIIKPNFFIKGIDRINILEEETCNKYCVKTVRVGTEKKYSSTHLVKYFNIN